MESKRVAPQMFDCALTATAPISAKMAAAGASIAWGPNLPSSPRTVRLNFHVMQKTDGSGNFPNDATTTTIFDQVMTRLNQMYDVIPKISSDTV